MSDERRCTATAKSTGERCTLPAIKGGSVCHMHGGAAEQVRKKADERLEEMATDLLEEFEPRLYDLFDQYDSVDDPAEKRKILNELRKATTDVLDRAGKGPTEKREHEDVTEGESGFGTTVVLDSEYASDAERE